MAFRYLRVALALSLSLPVEVVSALSSLDNARRHSRRQEIEQSEVALDSSFQKRDPGVVCFDADGQNYAATSGATFVVQCNTQYNGNQSSVANSSSLTACIESCMPDVCVGATFQNDGDDTQPGVCRTFSSISEAVPPAQAYPFLDSASIVQQSGVASDAPDPTTAPDPMSPSVTALDAPPVTTTTTSGSKSKKSKIKKAKQTTHTTKIAYTKIYVQAAHVCSGSSCKLTTTSTTKVQTSSVISCSPGTCTNIHGHTKSGLCFAPS